MVMGLDRARLTQERWFSLLRLLLLEVCVFQALQALVPAGSEIASLGPVVLAFVAYTLVVAILSFALRSWPPGLAYATAVIDTLAAILLVAFATDSPLDFGLIPIAAAGIAIGIRRFP